MTPTHATAWALVVMLCGAGCNESAPPQGSIPAETPAAEVAEAPTESGIATEVAAAEPAPIVCVPGERPAAERPANAPPLDWTQELNCLKADSRGRYSAPIKVAVPPRAAGSVTITGVELDKLTPKTLERQWVKYGEGPLAASFEVAGAPLTLEPGHSGTIMVTGRHLLITDESPIARGNFHFRLVGTLGGADGRPVELPLTVHVLAAPEPEPDGPAPHRRPPGDREPDP